MAEYWWLHRAHGVKVPRGSDWRVQSRDRGAGSAVGFLQERDSWCPMSLVWTGEGPESLGGGPRCGKGRYWWQ